MFGIPLAAGLNPRFSYCVIIIVSIIVIIVILLFLSYFFVDNYVGSRKQKLVRKKPKPRSIGIIYKECGKWGLNNGLFL